MYNKKTIEEILAAQNKGQRRKSREEEHQIQCACVKWFNLQYPEYRGLLFAVPNGGARSKATAGKLKAEGVVAGVSDLILLVPHLYPGGYTKHGLCIEIKTQKGTQSKEQKEWQKKVWMKGYNYVVCRSFEEFMAQVSYWIKYDETQPGYWKKYEEMTAIKSQSNKRRQ